MLVWKSRSEWVRQKNIICTVIAVPFRLFCACLHSNVYYSFCILYYVHYRVPHVVLNCISHTRKANSSCCERSCFISPRTWTYFNSVSQAFCCIPAAPNFYIVSVPAKNKIIPKVSSVFQPSSILFTHRNHQRCGLVHLNCKTNCVFKTNNSIVSHSSSSSGLVYVSAIDSAVPCVATNKRAWEL